jgi:hypothetical protein
MQWPGARPSPVDVLCCRSRCGSRDVDSACGLSPSASSSGPTRGYVGLVTITLPSTSPAVASQFTRHPVRTVPPASVAGMAVEQLPSSVPPRATLNVAVAVPFLPPAGLRPRARVRVRPGPHPGWHRGTHHDEGYVIAVMVQVCSIVRSVRHGLSQHAPARAGSGPIVDASDDRRLLERLREAPRFRGYASERRRAFHEGGPPG